MALSEAKKRCWCCCCWRCFVYCLYYKMLFLMVLAFNKTTGHTCFIFLADFAYLQTLKKAEIISRKFWTSSVVAMQRHQSHKNMFYKLKNKSTKSLLTRKDVGSRNVPQNAIQCNKSKWTLSLELSQSSIIVKFPPNALVRFGFIPIRRISRPE